MKVVTCASVTKSDTIIIVTVSVILPLSLSTPPPLNRRFSQSTWSRGARKLIMQFYHLSSFRYVQLTHAAVSLLFLTRKQFRFQSQHLLHTYCTIKLAYLTSDP